MSDKRSHTRHAIRLPLVLIRGDEEHPAFSGDIGLGGMFVHSEVVLPYGTRIRVRVQLPRLKAESTIEATVRWKSQEGMGIQFHQLRAREVWALNRLSRTTADD